MKRIFLCLIVSLFLASGCDLAGKEEVRAKQRKKGETQNKEIKKINNTNLAKVILKRKNHNLDVSKDPFMPIAKRKQFPRLNVPTTSTREIKEYQFMGVARIGDEYVAFLQSSDAKGTFRINDFVEGYIVKRISENQVVLSNGVQVVTLKRSDSREKYNN